MRKEGGIKMFKKIKNWLSSNKLEVLEVYSMTITALLVVVVLWAIIFTAISNDLVGVVDSKNTEIMEKNGTIEELTRQKLLAEMKADEIIQQYEDVIPKQQYIDDIEYLESVILELRTQCEQECSKCD
jgi:hypothetical protein